MTTLAPVWARIIAVFTTVVVFPSPGWLDVTSNVFGAPPADDNRTDVRSWRYDSAKGDRGGTFNKSSSPAWFPFFFWLPGMAESKRRRVKLPCEGMTARAGKRKKFSTSSDVRTESSR